MILTPEPYLGDVVKPASGTTNERGYASPSVTPDELPVAFKQRNIQVGGMYHGTYKITLFHPPLKRPELDASGRKLGEEVAQDTVDSSIRIELPARQQWWAD